MGNASSSPTLRDDALPTPAASNPAFSSSAPPSSAAAVNECPVQHHHPHQGTNSAQASTKPTSITAANKKNASATVCPSSLHPTKNNASSSSITAIANTNNSSSTWWWTKQTAGTGSSSSSSSIAGACPLPSSPSPSPLQQQPLPPSLEEAARYAQHRQFPDQRRPLSTQRVISTIPRAAVADSLDGLPTVTATETTCASTQGNLTSSSSSSSQVAADASKTDTSKASTTTTTATATLPPHQWNTTNTDVNPHNHWVYPSEQQFYNALRRKGWQDIPEDLIPNIVRIHNSVNEQGWRQVLFWEHLFLGHVSMADTLRQLRLVQLVGRPTTKSPHVYLSRILYPERQWFDRHDWYIDRGEIDDNGNRDRRPRRYILDFYEVVPTNAPIKAYPHRPSPTPTMYLHVRPALDTPQAAMDRLYMFFRNSFPGTALLLEQQHRKHRLLELEQQQQQREQEQRQQQENKLLNDSSSSSSSNTVHSKTSSLSSKSGGTNEKA